MNLHLEADEDPRTRQFVDEHNALSDAVLRTPEFARDRDAIKTLIERQDRLIVAMRRGGWLFDFRQSKDNPLGVWLRLPADQQPLPEADWEVVFDLDAFCLSEASAGPGAASSPARGNRRACCSRFRTAAQIFSGCSNSTQRTSRS